MTSAHYRLDSDAAQTSARRRIAAFALALAIELLLLLAFLTLNFHPDRKPEFQGGTIATFDVANADPWPQKTPQKQAEASPTPPRAAPPRPKIVLPPRPLQMIEVTRDVYAASDISKLGNKSPDAGQQVASGGAPGDSERVGTAPNGEPLYAAEWYREPTNAQLNAYLPKTMPEGGGSGLIACKTADRFRVVDCVELGNFPAGSHLAGAARQAAWQFLVRPPRVGGKTLVGEWVRIRIDYQVSARAQ